MNRSRVRRSSVCSSGEAVVMARLNWEDILRSSAANPASEQTATSPRVRALEQSKLGLALTGRGGDGVEEGSVTTGAVGGELSAPTVLASTGSEGAGAGWLTRARVASGVTIASALRSNTTLPLPSAAGCTV